MKITRDHPASSYGIPVIRDDDGQVMDYVPGIAKVLDRLGWGDQKGEWVNRHGVFSVATLDLLAEALERKEAE